MKLSREWFLGKLESVSPGLAKKSAIGIQQSDCFVFHKDKVFTFNDDAAGRAVLKIDEIEGAVDADKLLEVLRNLEEDFLDVEKKKGHLILRGKNGRESGVVMQDDVLLPISSIEKPGEWNPVQEEFSEAVNLVSRCTSANEDQFILTCVHIHPKWIEATDNFQVGRFVIDTGVSESALVRCKALKDIVAMGVTQISSSPSWLHLKTSAGAVLSCRRFQGEYADIGKVLDVKGSKIVLPKSLTSELKRCLIFSKDQAEGSCINVVLKDCRVSIKGVGIKGYYKAPEKVDYNGPPIMFRIDPETLTKIIESFNECAISEGRLKAVLGTYEYITLLESLREKELEDG